MELLSARLSLLGLMPRFGELSLNPMGLPDGLGLPVTKADWLFSKKKKNEG